MGKFIQLPQDLFDGDEIVHRVPVVSDVNRNNIIGTAYVSEDEIIIHLQSDTLKREVGPLLHLDLIRQFMLGLEYKIIEKERSMAEGHAWDDNGNILKVPPPKPPKDPAEPKKD